MATLPSDLTVADQPPTSISDERTLDEVMSRPSSGLIESIARGSGDLLVLGAGGKMGPTVARMARAAFQAAGRDGQVMAVSRFSDPAARAGLDAAGVRTLTGDLLDPEFLRELPDAPDVVFMAGRKFGSTGAEHLTWAMNAHIAGTGRAALSRCALRGLLHRRRLPVHGGRRAGRGRGRGSRADWGVRAVVPGKGADVRVRGAHLGHALGADPALVRTGPALWGAARHRGQPARRSASEPRDEPGPA